MKTLKQIIVLSIIMLLPVAKLSSQLQWTTIGSMVITGDVYDIHNDGDTVYLLAGTWAYKSYDKFNTYDSIKAGQTMFNRLTEMAVDSKGNVYFVLYTKDSTKVIKSSDGCKTFTDILKFKSIDKIEIAINDKDSILIRKDEYVEFKLYRSGNYGKTWTNVTSGLKMSSIPYLKAINNKFYAFNKDVYVSEDNGTSFTKIGNSIPDGNITSLNVDKNGNIYLGVVVSEPSYGTQILKSTDNGSTWQKIYDFGNTWQGSVNNIEIDNNSNIYLATSIYGVYYSSDGGTTWTNIGGSMFMRYNPKEGRVYSINNYHLAYINTGGGSSIGTISSNNLSIYPNPAFDYIFIKNYNSADVKIIDLNGRMYKLASNNGRVNISTLPKGMYLLTIGNNSYKFIKK